MGAKAVVALPESRPWHAGVRVSETEFGGAGEDALSFGADRRALAVTGVHHGVVGQREQHVTDRPQDRPFVAEAAPGRARASAEQGVTAEHHTGSDVVEAAAPG